MDRIRKIKREWIIRTIGILLLFFFTFTNPGRETLYAAEQVVGEVLSPFQNTVGKTGSHLASSINNLIHWNSLAQKNQILEEEVSTLKKENMDMREIIGRSQELHNEAIMKKNNPQKYIEAMVVAKSDNDVFAQFSIDKGEKDGISVGDTVVVASRNTGDVSVEGLVGRVENVSSHWSKVSTIVDRSNAVSFRSIRNSEGGVLKGEGSRLEGYAYDLQGDIVQGDELYTSGIGDVYVRDVYIGQVEAVATDTDKLTKIIQVKPNVDFHKLYKVFIITDDNQKGGRK